MAVREIKTSITLDGEQAFRQAIAAANKELRVSQSELKAVASAYDLSGDKMQMLADKQRILGDMVNQQENTTNALRRNLKELEEAYERAGRGVEEYRDKLRQAESTGDQGEIDRATKALRDAEAAYQQAGSKVQDYRIQVNNAEDKLNRFKRTQQEADREVEELGRDSIKAGRQIEDGIGDSAEAAEKDVRSLVNTLQDDLSSIRASTTFTAIGSLWDMATDAYSSVSGFVESTVDYRRQLSFLEQNAEDSGFGFELIKDKLIETQALTADASSAMEGLSNLIRIEGLNEEQLTHAMEGLLGASIKWQETLKFESLADSLQETLATGKAVGAYAELLERLGYNLDDFNAVLEKGELPADDIEAALAVLDAKDITEAYQEYKENNADLIEELETIARLEMSSARIGEIISRNVTTPIKGAFADTLSWMADEMERFEEDPDKYLEELPERVLEETKIDTTGMDPGEGKNKLEMRNAVLEAGRKIVAGEVDWKQKAEEAKESLRQAARELFGIDGIKTSWLDTVMPKIHQAAEQKREQERAAIDAVTDLALNGRLSIFYGLKTRERTDNWKDERAWLESTFAARENLKSREWWVDSARPIVNDFLRNFDFRWGEGANQEDAAKAAGQEAAQSYMEGWESMVMRPDLAVEAEGFGEAGDEAGDALGKGFLGEMEAAVDEARLAGENAALNFGAGLASKVSYVAAQAGALAAAANARLGASRGGGTVQVALNVDGRQMATALAPYNSEVMAVPLDATTPFQMR